MTGMQPAGAGRSGAATARFAAGATLALLLMFVACALWLALRRGPWLDEVWTLWQSRHDLPLAEVLRQRWLADFHPPLFSFTHWVASRWIGDSLLLHRLLNLLPLAWAAAFAWLGCRRFPHGAPLLLLFAVLMLSLPGSLEYFAESRSYFAQLCLTFALLAAVLVSLDTDRDLDWRRDRAWALMAGASVVLALNLHYVTTLLLGLLLAGQVLLCLWLGRPRWAALFAVSGALAAVPLLLYLWLQQPYLQKDSENYWVSMPLPQAAKLIVQRVTASLRNNPLAAAVAVAAIGLGLAGALWRRTGTPLRVPAAAQRLAVRLRLAPSRRRSALLLAATLLLFALAMLALHVRQPIVSGRYLLTFQAAVMALVACLAADAVVSRRLLFALAVVFAVAGIALETSRTLRESRWDASARQVSRWLADCPGSTVYATPLPRRTPWLLNAKPALHWGYEWQARRHGFAVRWLESGEPLPAVAGDCPALLWVEHVTGQLPADAAEALRRLGLPAQPQANLAVGDSGFVLRLPRPAAGVSTSSSLQ